MRKFKELIVWREGIEIVKATYSICENLHRKDYKLIDQMQRSAVSIPSNIAEGCAQSDKNFGRYLTIALGSSYELETQLYLLGELKKCDELTIFAINDKIKILQRRLVVLKSKVLGFNN